MGEKVTKKEEKVKPEPNESQKQTNKITTPLPTPKQVYTYFWNTVKLCCNVSYDSII